MRVLISDSVVSEADYKYLETLAKNITKEKQPFERLVMKKEDLLAMFEVYTITFLFDLSV
jgi:threonyl-tRNA synthetase